MYVCTQSLIDVAQLDMDDRSWLLCSMSWQHDEGLAPSATSHPTTSPLILAASCFYQFYFTYITIFNKPIPRGRNNAGLAKHSPGAKTMRDAGKPVANPA